MIPVPDKTRKSIAKLRSVLSEVPRVESRILRPIGDVLFRLWTHTWSKSELNTIGDPTICFVALSMIRKDGGWEGPAQVTPLIAKLEYGIRLLILTTLHETNPDNPAQMLQQCRELSPWFTEQVDSPFNSLRSLTHRATALVKSEMAVPRVIWVDRVTHRELRYKGDLIQFDSLTPMFDAIHKDAIALWETALMFGLPLRVNYQHICDDLTNSSIGYSFLSDPRNTIFQDRDQLTQHILTEPQLRKQFLINFADETAPPAWNQMALQKWLFNYSKFHMLLLVAIETMAGSPGRGTEICCLEYRNTATRPHRGLYMMGNHLAIVCRYHKGSSITGQDKTLPHALDAVTSDLLIQDLALARPFAELAVHLCYPRNMDIQGRYNSYLFVNNKNLFTTEQLTLSIRYYTTNTLKVALGLLDWRHLSAAFRRKICPALDDLIDEEDQGLDSVQALQSGHSRSTENRIYGISRDALKGPAEDVLPLFLDASTDWQVSTCIVPGGHGLPYYLARQADFKLLSTSGKIKANYTGPAKTLEMAMEGFSHKLKQELATQTEDILSKMLHMIEGLKSDIVGNTLTRMQFCLHSTSKN
jgi:hypothetical protein